MPFRSLGLKLQLIVQRRIERISQWARDEEQVEIQERLHQVFKTLVIFCHHEIYVNPQKIPELAVYPFDPENLASPALHFFQPWSTTQLAKYEKNLDTDETKMHLAYLEETIQMAHVATVHAFRPHVLEELEYIIKRLVWELETCPRRDTRNDSRPLSSITNWKISSFARPSLYHPALRKLTQSHTEELRCIGGSRWSTSMKSPTPRGIAIILGRYRKSCHMSK